jgi:C4-dicarboxylate-specific signal transduction histidine kinase
MPVEMPLLWLGNGAMALAIFVADTLTDREIAFAILHVVVVLVASRSGRPRAIAATGAACILLTIASYGLTPRGDREVGLANCALCLLAIGATTVLAVRIETAEAAARQLRADLARMARVTTVGELTLSVAHEVSQPLTAITAHGNAAIRWLSAVPPRPDEALRALDHLVRDADRAGAVIGRLRRLAAPAPAPRERVDIPEMIQETASLLRGELRLRHIVLRTELDEALPPVSGDRVLLQQVVLNFLVNAMEAMAETPPERREVLVGAAAGEGMITVSVRDRGAGLAPGAQEQAFDAFFTTKPSGMGMGLAISRSIIEAHGGSVYAAPNFPHGAVFGFRLPLPSSMGG